MPTLRQRISENPNELQALIAQLLTPVVFEPDAGLVNRIVKIIRQSVPEDYHWPGNVRELEQCIRRICITGTYQGYSRIQKPSTGLLDEVKAEEVSAQELMQHYCQLLYDRHQSYEAVARIAKLDRRTVKKYLDATWE